MNDRLTVKATDAPLADVVAEVARVTGIKIVGADKLQGRTTADFADLLIVDALKTLLTDVNYFVQQDQAPDRTGVGLILRVHSMARVSAGPAVDTALRVPALDAVLESEAEELAEEKQEAEDDPDVAQEQKAYLDTARQLQESGSFGSGTSVSSLAEYAHNENPAIRLEAVRALAQRPITEALPALLEALADDSIEVLRAAIEALARATDRESLQKVGLLLEKDEDLSVRYSALRVLAMRADAAATPHLQKVINDEDLTVRDAARQMIAEFERIARGKKEKAPPGR